MPSVRVLLSMLVILRVAAAAAEEREPIAPDGDLVPLARFDPEHQVRVARDGRLETYCFYSESGRRYRTTIGIGGRGAFLRLDSDNRPRRLPEPPIAFVAIADGDGGREVTARYEGQVALYRHDRRTDSVTVEALEEPEPFLDVLGKAHQAFVAWGPRDGAVEDYFQLRIYGFSPRAVDALMACAESEGLTR